MLGDGMLLNVTKNLAEGLGLSANVEFRGVLSPVEIRQLFEESLAFVQHSITLANGDSEGTPVAILDAQASSLPVVSTYHAGIPDVVADKCTGLLVEEKNIDGMTENMLRLLTEEGLAKTLGVAGRERVMKYFTLEKHLSTLESIIKDTVQNN
jgi:glycosyltransferase involved in cell wall biosynthesis